MAECYEYDAGAGRGDGRVQAVSIHATDQSDLFRRTMMQRCLRCIETVGSSDFHVESTSNHYRPVKSVDF